MNTDTSVSGHPVAWYKIGSESIQSSSIIGSQYPQMAGSSLNELWTFFFTPYLSFINTIGHFVTPVVVTYLLFK